MDKMSGRTTERGLKSGEFAQESPWLLEYCVQYDDMRVG